MPLAKDVYLGAIEREGQLLAKAGERSLGAVVPACPGWTVQSVLVHLGRVYRSVTEHVVARSTEMIPFAKTPSPDGFDVVSWYREGLDSMLEALRGIDPNEPVWSFSDNKTAGFYFRRMAHETAMHRFDAEAATGTPAPFDGDMAAYGIAELYESVLPAGLVRRKVTLPSGSLHLHRTDGDGVNEEQKRQRRVDDEVVRATHLRVVLVSRIDRGQRAHESPDAEHQHRQPL